MNFNLLESKQVDQISNQRDYIMPPDLQNRATVNGLLKNWPVKIRPVILALLLYANEVWRHIFKF